MTKQAKTKMLHEDVPEGAVATTSDQAKALALSDADAHAMYGDLRTTDYTIPRLVVLEGLSPEVTKEKAGHPGDLYVKSLKQNLGAEPFEFVILRRLGRSNLLWRPLKEGGGILCRADDGRTGVGTPGGDCAKCPKSLWTMSDKGERVAPECDENQNFVVVPRAMLTEPEAAFPYALSGAKARLHEFKNLNLMLTQLMGRRLPLYAKSLVATVKPKDSKTVSGAVYHVFTFTWGNDNALLPEAEIQAAASIAARFATAKVEEPLTDAPETTV